MHIVDNIITVAVVVEFIMMCNELCHSEIGRNQRINMTNILPYGIRIINENNT